MKCHFCKRYVNKKRQTTCYAFVPRKTGACQNLDELRRCRKVRWCKPCDDTRAKEIDKLLEGSA
jgi:hypothetical protein